MNEPLTVTFTVHQIWLAVLAIAGGIVSLSAAGTVIGKWIAGVKKPSQDIQKNSRDLKELKETVADMKLKLGELMQWKVKADGLFANDKKRLDRIDAGQRVEQQGILALLDHGLDGNNVAQMEKAKIALQEHLINH